MSGHSRACEGINSYVEFPTVHSLLNRWRFFVRPFALIFGLLALTPSVCLAAVVSPTLVPDGTYTVRVERIDDAKHVTVAMTNGMETTFPASGSVNFLSVKPNQTLKISVIKGAVPVYLIQR